MGATLALVVILALAAARLTRLITQDDVLEPWWRSRVLERFPQTPPGEEPRLRNKIGDLITCPFCTGVYCALGVIVVGHLVGLATWPVKWDLIMWPAVAGLQAAINVRLLE